MLPPSASFSQQPPRKVPSSKPTKPPSTTAPPSASPPHPPSPPQWPPHHAPALYHGRAPPLQPLGRSAVSRATPTSPSLAHSAVTPQPWSDTTRTPSPRPTPTL